MDYRWEIVKIVGTEQEAALIAGFLESEGLTCQIESLAFRQEPVTFGRLAEVRIQVPAEEVEAARRALERGFDPNSTTPESLDQTIQETGLGVPAEDEPPE